MAGENVADIFQNVDNNKDGIISQEEFLLLVDKITRPELVEGLKSAKKEIKNIPGLESLFKKTLASYKARIESLSASERNDYDLLLSTDQLLYEDEQNETISEKEYTIQKGDTLGSIAKKYTINRQKLYEHNKDVIGDDPNRIFPGQKIRIPGLTGSFEEYQTTGKKEYKDGDNHNIDSIQEDARYTLSKKDFDDNFSKELFKQGIGNCYLVSAIDGLMNLNKYEDIIRSSVRSDDKGGYYIKMPLGEPGASEYHVSFDQIVAEQRFVDKNYNLSRSIEHDNVPYMGINALMIAYGQRVLGRQYFDFKRLESLFIKDSGDDILTLLGEENIDTVVHQKEQKGFAENRNNVLNGFNPQEQILLLGVHSLDQTLPGIYNYADISNENSGNHQICVEKVDGYYVYVSDPNNASLQSKFPRHTFINKVASFSISTVTQNPFDNKTLDQTKDTVHNDRRTGTIYDQDWAGELGSNKNIEQSYTEKVQKTGKENFRLRDERGDIICYKAQESLGANNVLDSYPIRSYNQLNSMTVEYSKTAIPGLTTGCKRENSNIGPETVHRHKYHFKIGNDILTVDQNNIPAYYKKSKVLDRTHYPVLITNFFHKMVNDYIDPQLSHSKDPFSLQNGKLEFSDDAGKSDRSWMKKMITDDVTVLSDRSKLGIKTTNTKTQQQICDFLNTLYNKKNSPKKIPYNFKK